MKKIYNIFTLMVLFVALTSTIFSPKKDNKQFDLPPFTDSLELNLPEIPFNYSDIDFPVHVEQFIGLWGSDTSSLTSMTDEGATLGRVLFYDVRLSGDNTLSCGSCHKQELSFADNKPLSDGIDGQFTFRNSMHLNDLLWQSGMSFFWDSRSPTLEDAVIQPILATNELGKNIPNLLAKLENTEFYPQLFDDAFGSSDITEERIASALAQFIRSMTTFNSRFDQSYDNLLADFSQSEFEGFLLFENACQNCHFPPHFGSGSNLTLFNGTNGLDSVFTDLGMGGWMGSFFDGVFRVPSLKNIAVTAPYMHDGRFETLADVINFYSEEVQFNENSGFNWMFGESFDGFHFSDEEKQNLEAFLLTLTDESFLTDEKWSNPWSPIVSTTSYITESGFKVQAYPNPVEDFINVEFPNPSFSEINIQLYNISGQLVKSYKTQGDQFNIKRGKLPAGIYKLVVNNGPESQTKKILLK